MTEVAYGWHTVGTLLRVDPERIAELLIGEGRRDPRARQVAERAEAAGVPVRWVSAAELTAAAGHARHQGVVAFIHAAHTSLTLDALLSGAPLPGVERRQPLDPPLYLVLDGVTDPHNLGACLRTADAAGVRAVILPKDRSVGITPVVRKVACGAAEVVPILFVTNLARTLVALQEAGVWVVGLAGGCDTELYAVDLTGPTALVLGAEGQGLRRLTREHCDQLVRLPMLGVVESLNVSVAAGIACYEAVRQRTRNLAR